MESTQNEAAAWVGKGFRGKPAEIMFYYSEVHLGQVLLYEDEQ